MVGDPGGLSVDSLAVSAFRLVKLSLIFTTQNVKVNARATTLKKGEFVTGNSPLSSKFFKYKKEKKQKRQLYYALKLMQGITRRKLHD